MKRWKKSDTCLNCQEKIDVSFNYCPHCGQENDDRNVSFFKLINEFFSNYLSLDSRFGRSIIPFLINPGFLTNRFNQGKRKNYANPIRLYLVISLFYFFFMSLYLDQHSDLFSEDNKNFNAPLPDSARVAIGNDAIQNINKVIDEIDSVDIENFSLDSINIDSLDLDSIDRVKFENSNPGLIPLANSKSRTLETAFLVMIPGGH